eukprot:scaffold293551_cov31-Tisochrysis_lutea.AAC.5
MFMYRAREKDGRKRDGAGREEGMEKWGEFSYVHWVRGGERASGWHVPMKKCEPMERRGLGWGRAIDSERVRAGDACGRHTRVRVEGRDAPRRRRERGRGAGGEWRGGKGKQGVLAGHLV